MWSREKIAQLSTKLNMSETQIYKWWWDQTRKRAKKLNQEKEGLKKKGRQSISLESLSEADLIIPQTDEFGGYSSRLRLNENYVSKKKEI